MKIVEIYTSPYCEFCFRAKLLLEKKHINFNEIDVINYPGRREQMVKRAKGKNTLPQIFIDEVHVGGCDDLYALDQKGELDVLLS